MPGEFLGWWHDYDEGIDSGIDIRSDEIVEQVKHGNKKEDICKYRYKVVKAFPKQGEAYLLTGYLCPEYGGEPSHYSYTKISEKPMAGVAEETNRKYRHMRIYHLDCGLTKNDWDRFDPSTMWSDMIGSSGRCEYKYTPFASSDDVPNSSPYSRER